MPTKSELRALYLERRRRLTESDSILKSAAIVARLRRHDRFANAATVLSYVASKDNEVDTKPLIQSMLEEGKIIFVPCTNIDDTLMWSRLEALDELVLGRYGILAPGAPRRDMAPSPDDPVLVPGIAFAPTGHRIGYGKGFFDRFLGSHRGLKIGLAYDAQITDRIRPEEHDVAVDLVVTESRTYDCSASRDSR